MKWLKNEVVSLFLLAAIGSLATFIPVWWLTYPLVALAVFAMVFIVFRVYNQSPFLQPDTINTTVTGIINDAIDEVPNEGLVTESINGWKTARLYVDFANKKAHFEPLTGPYSYQTQDYAFCRTCGLDCPTLTCMCGFWAFTQQTQAEEIRDNYQANCLLRVQAWGKILQYSYGWRASEQEVMRVLLPSFCKCKKSATVLFINEDSFLQVSCQNCSKGAPTFSCSELSCILTTEVAFAS